ncbi:MAG: CRISPR-associated endonuclease Cas1 [Vampirovibrionia bacterium]
MQLVINTYGAYLKKKDNCFLIKIEDRSQEVSVKKVSSILITTSVLVSSDALQLAVENNIDVVFMDHFGEPFGRLWHSKLGSTTLIRRKQLEASCSKEGLNFVKDWTTQKINNQKAFLQKLKDKRPDNETLSPAIKNIESFIEKINNLTGTVDENRSTIMGYEGNASKNYFEALSSIMPEKYKFNGRSRMPAMDEFNAMLNYGYGVLYSKVEKACLIAGLDPYVGFLHADNYNKKSLVFDIIELYRDLIDQTVVYLFTGKKVKDSFFDAYSTGMTLNKSGKETLIKAINEAFDDTVRYKNKNIKNIDKIQFDCHEIAQTLLKES